eukprot:TCONS_00003837-protein
MFYKYTYNHSSVHAIETLLIRYVISFVIISSNMAAERLSPFDSLKNTAFLVVAGLFRLIGVILLNMSLARIELGTHAVILASQPTFAITIARYMLSEKMALSESLLGLVSYTGIIIVVWDRLTEHRAYPHEYVMGLIYGYLALLAFSFYYVNLRRVSGTVSLRKSIFYTTLVGVIILPLASFVPGMDFELTKVPVRFTYYVLTGGLILFFALITEVVSLKCLNIGLVMVLRNTEFIWAYLYDIVMTRVYPTLLVVIGMVLLIGSVSLIAINLIREIPYRKGRNYLISKIHACFCYGTDDG